MLILVLVLVLMLVLVCVQKKKCMYVCMYVWVVGVEGLSARSMTATPGHYLEGSQFMEMGCKESSTANACHQVL